MSSTSPFKLLDAYNKGDDASYFGRKREVAQLYNAVFAGRLTLLYGASGTGKTSLVQCGLENKFYATDWLPLFVRRNQNLNQALRQAIATALPEATRPAELATLTLEEQLRLLYLQHFRTIYLIFDQFEELFIEGDEAEQLQFYQDIRNLLQSEQHAKVLIIMREEWLGHLNTFERIVPTLFDNRLRIERMREQLLWRTVIPGLIRSANIELHEPRETVPLIIQQIKDPREGVDLADLQVYLDRLYRKAAEAQAPAAPAQKLSFDRALVEQVGEIKNVLSVFLDEQMLALETKLKEKFNIEDPSNIPLDILYTLVTNEQTKRSLDFAAIQEQLPQNRGITPEVVAYCLEQMEDMRLLNLND